MWRGCKDVIAGMLFNFEPNEVRLGHICLLALGLKQKPS